MMGRIPRCAQKRYFSFEILAIATDARDSTGPSERRSPASLTRSPDTRVIAAAAMTDVVDVQIEMLLQKNGGSVKVRVRREYYARRSDPA